MRKFWLTLGWASAVGSVIDAIILLYAIYVIAVFVEHTWALSSEVLFRDHISWLYWVKQLAYYFMPAETVHWLFGLPATILFSTRIVISILVGKWALNKADALRPAPAT